MHCQMSSYLFLRASSAELMKEASSTLYCNRWENKTLLASFYALLAALQSLRRVNSLSGADCMAVASP